MAEVTETTLIVRNDALPTGEIDGELVALDLDSGNCFGLDRVGSDLWRLVAEPTPVGSVAASLADDYAVSPEQCLADIIPFIEDMIGEGLLRRVEG